MFFFVVFLFFCVERIEDRGERERGGDSTSEMEERKKDSKERESESRVVFPLRSVLLDLLSAKKERKNALKKKKKKLSPSQKHRPPDDRDQEVARLRDELERPRQPEERVDVEEGLVVGDVDGRLIRGRQLLRPDDSHPVKGRGGGLGPPVVDEMLGAPPLRVEEGDERGEEEHGGEERDGEGKGDRVEEQALDVGEKGGEGRFGRRFDREGFRC